MSSPYGPGAPPLGNPRAMTERSPATVVILGIVTCGIYLLVWGYQTTDELRVATGDETLKPGLDLLLTFVTCGVWWIYTDYRNAKKVWELGNRMGLRRSDQSTMVLVLDFVAMLITPAILQSEYNEIAKAARGLGPAGHGLAAPTHRPAWPLARPDTFRPAGIQPRARKAGAPDAPTVPGAAWRRKSPSAQAPAEPRSLGGSDGPWPPARAWTPTKPCDSGFPRLEVV